MCARAINCNRFGFDAHFILVWEKKLSVNRMNDGCIYFRRIECDSSQCMCCGFGCVCVCVCDVNERVRADATWNLFIEIILALYRNTRLIIYLFGMVSVAVFLCSLKIKTQSYCAVVLPHCKKIEGSSEHIHIGSY